MNVKESAIRDQEAGKLVDVRESDHPHAFVIACIMDRLIKAERAWFNPYRLSRRIGNFYFCTLLKLSEDEIQDHMKGPPALHWFPDKMSQYIHAALRHIADKYEGKAENTSGPFSNNSLFHFETVMGWT